MKPFLREKLHSSKIHGPQVGPVFFVFTKVKEIFYWEVKKGFFVK